MIYPFLGPHRMHFHVDWFGAIITARKVVKLQFVSSIMHHSLNVYVYRA